MSSAKMAFWPLFRMPVFVVKIAGLQLTLYDEMASNVGGGATWREPMQLIVVEAAAHQL